MHATAPFLPPAKATAPRKGRLLFVDDEEMVLQGLRRTLRPHGGEWECEFRASAGEAIAAMERAPFDAVITDSRMPGRSGSELLAETARRWPETVRIVLSGHSEQAMVMQCIEVAHQYLAKPCEPALLVETVRRTVSLHEALGGEAVRRIVSRARALPSKPELYLEIVGRLHDPEAGIGEIAAIVERDPAMAAKVLKLVNSAFFGHPRRMASVAEAIGCLGLDTVRALVLAIDVLEPFPGAGAMRRRLGDMWEHAYHVACAAREIAAREGAEPHVVDEAFAAGLLHDAGKLIFATSFPEEYEACFAGTQGRGELACAAEEARFGVSHALAGAYLFGLWGLPPAVVEAVAFHHDPRRGAGRGFTALTAVHVADALVHRLDPAALPGAAGLLDAGYLEEHGLAGRLPAWEEVV